ncbi:zinc ribbon domain-containing protein [candidate division KSB1 bacterium]
MPIYEFNCRDCNKKFDDLFSSYDISDMEVVCTHCGSNKTERILSLFSSPGVTAGDSCSSCSSSSCSSCSCG